MAGWLDTIDYLTDPTTDLINDLARRYSGDLLFPAERLKKFRNEQAVRRAPLPGRDVDPQTFLRPPPATTLQSLGESYRPNLGLQGGGGVPQVSGGITLPELGDMQLRGMYQRNPQGRDDWMLGLERRF